MTRRRRLLVALAPVILATTVACTDYRTSVAPVEKVCGTALITGSAAGPAIDDLTRGPVSIHAPSLDGHIFLKVAAGCSRGATLAIVPTNAAAVVKRVKTHDGKLAAVVVQPNAAQFDMLVTRADGSTVIAEVQMQPSGSAVNTSIEAGRCPPTSPLNFRNPGPRLDDILVPVAARKLILCRYNGANATPWLGLTESKVVVDAQAADRWRQRFNSLPALQPGANDCPLDDDGSSILAVFVASATSYTVVQVQLRGCRVASNGRIGQVADAVFVTDLQDLVVR